MDRPKILIADDHRLLSDSLREMLASEYDIVGTVSDGRAVLSAVETSTPDLILMDISMPSLNGLDCALQLRQTGCQAKILILTMHPDATLAREAMEAGASGYILKTSPASELKSAIRDVLRGRTYLSPAVTRDFTELEGRAKERDDVWARLTSRQREVLQLLAEGKSHKEVAAVLGVSIKTAEYHKYTIMHTLGLKTNADLVQYAVRQGIITI